MATVQDINAEIGRIAAAKANIIGAIEQKGVSVPADAMIQDLPQKILQIETGTPNAVQYVPQELTTEQKQQARENIGAESISNKVNSISKQSTTTEYPCAKAVYDAINPAVQSSVPVGGFLPNVIYDLGELTGNVAFALATPTDNAIANPYNWNFETGATPPNVTWPSGVIWPDGVSEPVAEANKHYEIRVRGMYISMLVYSLPTA